MAELAPDGKLTIPTLLSLLNESERELSVLGIAPQALVDIYHDFQGRHTELTDIAGYITTILQEVSEVHAVRYRIKEPLHLLKKIIRKKKEYPHRSFDACSYLDFINDLIGVRVLYLNKNSWAEIGGYIQNRWELKRQPIAYISTEDAQAYTPDFEQYGCRVIVHPNGYRAVHFVIETKPNKQPYFAEIQLRTLVEETWSELDHSIRYPDQDNSELSVLLLKLLNKLTGSADKIAALIPQLTARLATCKQASEKDQQKTAAQLTALLHALPIREEEKQPLYTYISRIKTKDKS